MIINMMIMIMIIIIRPELPAMIQGDQLGDELCRRRETPCKIAGTASPGTNLYTDTTSNTDTNTDENTEKDIDKSTDKNTDENIDKNSDTNTDTNTDTNRGANSGHKYRYKYEDKSHHPLTVADWLDQLTEQLICKGVATFRQNQFAL